MDKYTLNVFMSLFSAVFGIFAIASGLSGFVVFDDYVAPVCEFAEDCSAGTVCCILPDEQAGICTSEDMCSQVRAMPPKTVEEGFLNPPIVQIICGTLLMLLAGVILYFTARNATPKKSRHTHH